MEAVETGPPALPQYGIPPQPWEMYSSPFPKTPRLSMESREPKLRYSLAHYYRHIMKFACGLNKNNSS